MAAQAVTAAAPIIIARRDISRREFVATVIRSPLSMPVAIPRKDGRRKVLDHRFWIM
ncbi:hypothetical protein QP162_11415 [Sphingomonas aurantiaca]|uniref:hypothetical protein n=1 Tax=Sphingomonas aurantiaca TaxID=185949 RepID=UPI002FE0F419